MRFFPRIPTLILLLCAARPVFAAPQTQPATRPLIEIHSKVFTVFLDVNDSPASKAWALKAARYAISVYPRIVAQLPSHGFEAPRFAIFVFKVMPGVAYTSRTTVTISALWIRRYPDDFGMVAHELTHVVQHYQVVDNKAIWLVEGMADYIRYYVIEPDSPRRRFNPNRSSYRNGYQPAAGMLNWVVRTHDPEFIVKINAALRDGIYSPKVFAALAGGSPDQIWQRFKATLPETATQPRGGAATQPMN